MILCQAFGICARLWSSSVVLCIFLNAIVSRVIAHKRSTFLSEGDIFLQGNINLATYTLIQDSHASTMYRIFDQLLGTWLRSPMFL